MIKRILIPLDPSPYTDTAVRIGCAIAKQTDAEIEGLAILDAPGIEKSIGPVPLGGTSYAEHLAKFKEEEAHERIQTLLGKFKQTCREQGVRHREAERQGGPSAQIVAESMFYDLVVVGSRTNFEFETGSKPGKTLDHILDHSVTPVLALPKALELPDPSVKKINVLVAFDGSHPSARALHAFAQLAVPDAMDVLLLSSGSNEDEAGELLNRAEAYLKAHGLSRMRKEWTSLEIRDEIREKYLDWPDLFVVGAHAKKGIFDFMLSNLTDYLVKEVEKAILIGQ